MAGKRQRANGTWEYRFQRKGLLPQPVYFTFDTEAEGDAYTARVEPLLERGIVPPEFTGGSIDTFGALIDLFEVTANPSDNDVSMIPALRVKIADVKLTRLTYPWVESWVTEMQREGMAVSTIKKRVGLLARVVDWAMRSNKLELGNNPVRLLPRGFVSKGVAKEKLWAGERDRRLSATEEGAIRKVLVKKEEHLMFDIALETGMRMSEIFTLTKDQVSLEQRTIFLDKSKNGDKRQVPITSTLHKIIEPWLEGSPEDLLLPFWDGKEAIKKVTNRLSHLFKSRFVKAKAPDLNFHDLRHEATSRFFERTRLTDTEIASITGHKDPRMLRRYANLRGSNLATKLW